MYSAYARFAERLQLTRNKFVSECLFGEAVSPQTNFGFPIHLERLLQQIPGREELKTSDIITNHSHLPFYAPFVLPERLTSATRMMNSGKSRRVIKIAETLSGNRQLLHCPACFKENRAKWGEPYWHREHQIPGIQVCSTHAVFLERSGIPDGNSEYEDFYVTAQRACRPGRARALDNSNPVHQLMLMLSEDAKWLLGLKSNLGGIVQTQERYIRLLNRQGLYGYGGAVCHDLFQERFIKHYGSATLNALGIPLVKQVRNWFQMSWLSALVRNPHVSHTPVKHLLLIYFFGERTEGFFRLNRPRYVVPGEVLDL